MICRILDKMDILEMRLDKQNLINARLDMRINKVNRYARIIGIMAVGYACYTYASTCKSIRKQALKIEEIQNKIDGSEDMKG